ncbi:AraC family transcriptional regulator [Sphingomonas sp. KC8]|uniref:AraC family transcriptional regulator n=1 Tax=Sphingomonas sp. KC8 TaxID=1030157 RepID=UPI0002488A96|nr:helix-turn-helix transcriptional regulator [Sphingomonas sp. KC8]ARS27495.1 AraC family transcriptional regulator [Sphingomonas sp. KC8]
MKTLNPAETEQVLESYGLTTPAGTGFDFRDPMRAVHYGWHAHPYHQLLYAISGTTQIETHAARLFLPPGRAAWIPAGLRHRTLISDVDGASLYFAPEAVPQPGARLRILIATPIMREMILHALRWPQGTSAADPLAQSFFATLALLCGEWLESELPLSLPRATSPAITRAMDRAIADPATMTQADALAAAHMSERSFRRAFSSETGMSWQAWLGQARILAAMALLAQGQRVTDVAADVGFQSLSAFAKAFARLTGEVPTEYRRRATATGGHPVNAADRAAPGW